MAFNVLSFVAVVLGLYLLYEVDRQDSKTAKVICAFAGLVAVFWALTVVFGACGVRLSAMPAAFALFAIVSLYSEGATRAMSGAVAVILFLALVY